MSISKVAVSGKTLDEIRAVLQEHKDILQTRFHVRRIGIFGSYARGEHTPQSDVDIFVELEHPVGWEIVDLQQYLEQILGIRVDLLTAGAARRKPRLWQYIEEDIIYV